jgi:hypothetical protein
MRLTWRISFFLLGENFMKLGHAGVRGGSDSGATPYGVLKLRMVLDNLKYATSSCIGKKGKAVPLHAMEALWVRGGVARTLS